MKLIIINATAAKYGGAETIIRTFIDSIKENKDYHYYIISPLNFDLYRSNITFIKKETKGIQSILFATVGILYYMIKLRAYKIISFSNVNSIIFTKKGITYFHQSKALNKYNHPKLRAYRFLIRYALKGNTFIVQSEHIKQQFIKLFKFSDEKVISCWPGFSNELPNQNNNTLQFVKEIKNNYIGIVPISYNASHKNLTLIEKLIPFFKSNNVKIVTLLPSDSEIFTDADVFINLGQIPRRDLFALYQYVDFLIFPSKDETVGLPIFEFMQFGKPAFVFNAPYASCFYEKFKKPKNLILFKNIQEFQDLYPVLINEKYEKHDFSQGEWEKIFNLL